MMRWFGFAMLLLPTPVAFAAGSCTGLSVTNLVFGNYTGASAVSSTATITVSCTSGFAYALGLGTGTSGSTTGRTMRTSPVTTTLGYGMYQDAAHSINWGDKNGVDTVSSTGTGSNQTFTIYGLAPAGQNVAPGSYSDYPNTYVPSGPNVTLNVSATVHASCAISAGNLQFGAYAGGTLYANSNLSVNCTDTTAYNIGLSAGATAGATVTTRAMKGTGSNTLAYFLFQSNTYSTNWGNTVGTDTVAGTGTGNTQTVTVYGEIAAGLYVTPGNYSDTIAVTLTY